jgi:hypothetical protein
MKSPMLIARTRTCTLVVGCVCVCGTTSLERSLDAWPWTRRVEWNKRAQAERAAFDAALMPELTPVLRGYAGPPVVLDLTVDLSPACSPAIWLRSGSRTAPKVATVRTCYTSLYRGAPCG